MTERPRRAALLLLALTPFLQACHQPSGPVLNPARADAAVRRLRSDIDSMLATPSLDRATWGVLVESFARKQVLYSLNAGKLLTPASNMKIVTLAVASQRLGWEYQYETKLAATGPLHDGLLDGDLLVVGTGDPSIDDWDGAATRLFEDWANQLKGRGVHAISGRIVGDDRAFADEPFGAGWAWDDLAHSYGAAVGALQFDENTARLVVEAGPAAGTPAAARIQQDGSGLEIRNEVVTAAPDTSPSVSVERLAGTSLLAVRGSIPAGAAAASRISVNVSVVNPTVYFVTALRKALVRAGIEVRGEAVDVDDLQDVPAPSAVLVSHRSAPLVELSATMMKNSQNLYAESLLRTLGGTPATFAAARGSALSVLRGWGIPASDVVIADGSGLSRSDLITCSSAVAVLRHVKSDEQLRDAFERSLPIAGVDGTLAHRMKGTPAEGRVRAKTGSLSNVRAISGYAETADGEQLVFSIIANNFGVPGESVEKTEDAIIVRLTAFSRR